MFGRQPNRSFNSICVLSFSMCMIVGVPALGQVASAPQIGMNLSAINQSSDIDSVNLSNGNVYVHIPLLSYPQLGDKLRLNFMVRFNQPQWVVGVGNNFYNLTTGQNYYFGGWGINQNNPYPIGVDVVRDQGITLQTAYEQFMCVAPDGSGAADCGDGSVSTVNGAVLNPYSYKIYETLRDRTGATRFVDYGTEWMGSPNAPAGTSAYAADGSGWIAKNYGQLYVDRDGNSYSTKTVGTVNGQTLSAHDITDVYGHTITTSANGWTDSVGRIIPGSYTGPGSGVEDDPVPGVVTNDLSQCDPGTSTAREWDVPWLNGSTAKYKLCYVPQSEQTSFNVRTMNGYTSTISEASATGIPMLSQIVLPNGNSYRFTYDGYLELTSIGLPTGGFISYLWDTISWDTHSTSNPLSRAVVSRSVMSASGTTNTTTYHWATTSSLAVSGSLPSNNNPGETVVNVIVSKPDGNDEFHQTTTPHTGGTSTSVYVKGRIDLAYLTNPYTNGVISLPNTLKKEVTSHQILPSPFFESLPKLPLTSDGPHQQTGQYVAPWSFQVEYLGKPLSKTTTLEDGTTSQETYSYVSGQSMTYHDPGYNRLWEGDQNKNRNLCVPGLRCFVRQVHL